MLYLIVLGSEVQARGKHTMAVPLTFCMQLELHLLKIRNLAPSKGTAVECSSSWHTASKTHLSWNSKQ